MQDRWDTQALNAIPCRFLRQWRARLSLNETSVFPTSSALTSLYRQQYPTSQYQFVVQSPDDEQEDYYENLIAHHHKIPTRANNWHDFLNAMVWLQFPLTKARISQYHADDIAEFGLVPRTPRRDRLTHFDECGVLLLVKESDAPKLDDFFKALCTHQWQQVFVDNRNLWHSKVQPCLFGHATMEMLLTPFVGLTGKWLAVVVDDGFDTFDEAAKREHIDKRLLATLDNFNGLASKQVLRPIPVLGIPGWFEEQNREFYGNADYFRPQRKGVLLSEQYPIRRLGVTD
jgi:hypothetical protein